MELEFAKTPGVLFVPKIPVSESESQLYQFGDAMDL